MVHTAMAMLDALQLDAVQFDIQEDPVLLDDLNLEHIFQDLAKHLEGDDPLEAQPFHFDEESSGGKHAAAAVAAAGPFHYFYEHQRQHAHKGKALGGKSLSLSDMQPCSAPLGQPLPLLKPAPVPAPAPASASPAAVARAGSSPLPVAPRPVVHVSAEAPEVPVSRRSLNIAKRPRSRSVPRGRKMIEEAKAVIQEHAAMDSSSEDEFYEEEDGGKELQHKRARNRLHAKRSRTRKKQCMEVLEEQLLALRSENLGLRQLVLNKIPEGADKVLQDCCRGEDEGALAAASVICGPTSRSVLKGTDFVSKFSSAADATPPTSEGSSADEGDRRRGAPSAAAVHGAVPNALSLMREDFKLIGSLRASQQNFALTDAARPGAPLAYVSAGFLALTGHPADKLLGSGLRVLAGPSTDALALSILDNNLAAGRETSLCLLCYRADGTPFWGQLYVSALRDRAGAVTAHVACLSEVDALPIEEFRRRLRRVPLPRDLIAADDARAAAAAAHRSAGGQYGSGSFAAAAAAAPRARSSTASAGDSADGGGSSGDGGSGGGGAEEDGEWVDKEGVPTPQWVTDPLRRTRLARRSSSIC